jgi:hypothetical protein
MESKTGRPSAYTQAIGDYICERLATSNVSLRKICEEDGVPSISSVMRWLAENEAFRAQYAHAREAQADFLAEEIIEIADDSSRDTIAIEKNGQTIEIEDKEWTSRAKLRVDARKWIASKLKPKKYGDKLELDNKVSGKLQVETITGMEVK